MEITFLGTGTSQGVPIIGCDCEVCSSTDSRDKRLRCSILIQDEHHQVVVDTGPDFRQQMLREGVKKLDAVVFTHEHKDHLAGLDDIRPFNFLWKQKMDIYASEQVQAAIRREFAYVFAPVKYPGIPELALHTIDDETPFQIGALRFEPLLVYHYKLPVLGFRIGNFAYVTDANRIPAATMKKLKGVDTLVLNALRRESHISHFTLEEAIELMQVIRPRKGYFIHMSHQMGLHADVAKELPDFVELAYDGLKITVNS